MIKHHVGAVVSAVFLAAAASATSGDIVYSGPPAGSWFDASNWSNTATTPPTTGTLPSSANATNVNNGTVNSGVVFDPAAQGGAAGTYQIGRLYVSSANSGAGTANFPGTTPQPNTLTVRSGTLQSVNDYALVGRSLSGTLLVDGGTYVSDIRIEAGQTSTTTGNGTIDYAGGSIVAGFGTTPGTASGIRLGGVAGSTGTFISRNSGAAGHAHFSNFYTGYAGTGVSEFHYANGGTRPVQVDGQFSIRNSGTQSSRLSFVLDAAPALVASGAPVSLGLFDVDFDGNAGTTDVITGVTGQSKNFFSPTGTTELTEGSTVAASFGGVAYAWKISYTGNITFSGDAVTAITGPGTGRDVVLIGVIPEPASLALFAAGIAVLRRRQTR